MDSHRSSVAAAESHSRSNSSVSGAAEFKPRSNSSFTGVYAQRVGGGLQLSGLLAAKSLARRTRSKLVTRERAVRGASLVNVKPAGLPPTPRDSEHKGNMSITGLLAAKSFAHRTRSRLAKEHLSPVTRKQSHWRSGLKTGPLFFPSGDEYLYPAGSVPSSPVKLTVDAATALTYSEPELFMMTADIRDAWKRIRPVEQELRAATNAVNREMYMPSDSSVQIAHTCFTHCQLLGQILNGHTIDDLSMHPRELHDFYIQVSVLTDCTWAMQSTIQSLVDDTVSLNEKVASLEHAYDSLQAQEISGYSNMYSILQQKQDDVQKLVTKLEKANSMLDDKAKKLLDFAEVEDILRELSTVAMEFRDQLSVPVDSMNVVDQAKLVKSKFVGMERQLTEHGSNGHRKKRERVHRVLSKGESSAENLLKTSKGVGSPRSPRPKGKLNAQGESKPSVLNVAVAVTRTVLNRVQSSKVKSEEGGGMGKPPASLLRTRSTVLARSPTSARLSTIETPKRSSDDSTGSMRKSALSTSSSVEKVDDVVIKVLRVDTPEDMQQQEEESSNDSRTLSFGDEETLSEDGSVERNVSTEEPFATNEDKLVHDIKELARHASVSSEGRRESRAPPPVAQDTHTSTSSDVSSTEDETKIVYGSGSVPASDTDANDRQNRAKSGLKPLSQDGAALSSLENLEKYGPWKDGEESVGSTTHSYSGSHTNKRVGSKSSKRGMVDSREGSSEHFSKVTFNDDDSITVDGDGVHPYASRGPSREVSPPLRHPRHAHNRRTVNSAGGVDEGSSNAITGTSPPHQTRGDHGDFFFASERGKSGDNGSIGSRGGGMDSITGGLSVESSLTNGILFAVIRDTDLVKKLKWLLGELIDIQAAVLSPTDGHVSLKRLREHATTLHCAGIPLLKKICRGYDDMTRKWNRATHGLMRSYDLRGGDADSAMVCPFCGIDGRHTSTHTYAKDQRTSPLTAPHSNNNFSSRTSSRWGSQSPHTLHSSHGRSRGHFSRGAEDEDSYF